jgi:hypothetical protein
MKTRIELGVIRPCRKADIDPKRPGHRVCLYSRRRPRRVLGRHRTYRAALRQERAIKARGG